MDSAARICKKCLLREMDEAGFFQNMYTYIQNLDPEDKVSNPEYEQRLMKCKQCDQLLSGMCRVCGCYVEMRAAMKVRHCPAIHPQW